jgi:hypothetical protein
MRFRPQSHTVFRRAGDELILVNVTTNRMFSANETGAAIWDALVRGEDVSDLKDQWLASTSLPETPADVDAFVEILIGEGLIENA